MYISFARSTTSPQFYTPMPLKIISFTFPIPGSLRTVLCLKQDRMSGTDGGKYVRPSGLFTSEQILASNLLHAIPPEAVNMVLSFISCRIFYPRKIHPSSESSPFSFRYCVTSRSTSSNPSDSYYSSYCSAMRRNLSATALYLG